MEFRKLQPLAKTRISSSSELAAQDIEDEKFISTLKITDLQETFFKRMTMSKVVFRGR